MQVYWLLNLPMRQVAWESGQTSFPDFVSTHPLPPKGVTLFSGGGGGGGKSRNRRLLSWAWRQVILAIKVVDFKPAL